MKRPLMMLCTLAIATAAGAGQYNPVLDIGDAMPAFEKLPVATGGELSSPDLKEDVVVLVSLANHCPWVRGMDGDLVKLVDSLEGRSVRVVGFSVNHRAEDRLPAMKEHAQKTGYNFAYLYDDDHEGAGKPTKKAIAVAEKAVTSARAALDGADEAARPGAEAAFAEAEATLAKLKG